MISDTAKPAVTLQSFATANIVSVNPVIRAPLMIPTQTSDQTFTSLVQPIFNANSLKSIEVSYIPRFILSLALLTLQQASLYDQSKLNVFCAPFAMLFSRFHNRLTWLKYKTGFSASSWPFCSTLMSQATRMD